MFARAFVNIGVLPGIGRNHIALEIGAFPILRVAGRLKEILQSVFAFRIESVVNFELIKRGSKIGNLGLGCSVASLLGASGKPGDYQGGQNSEDRQYQQQFHKRKTV